MRPYILSCELLVHLPIQETFAVFEDPYNLARITPPWLAFRVVSPNPVHMRKNAEIRYRIRWLGLPLSWKTLINEYDPPHLFVDEQAEGPYALWRHRHTFIDTPEGTKVQDRVEYLLPFGALGRLAHRAVVEKQLKGIFRYRQVALTELFKGKASRTVDPIVQLAP